MNPYAHSWSVFLAAAAVSLSGFVSLFPLGVLAAATSSEYTIRQSSIGADGGRATSSAYQVDAAVGGVGGLVQSASGHYAVLAGPSGVAAGEIDLSPTLLPVISWAAPEAISYGTPLGPAQLNATADVPGTFAYEPAGGVILSAGQGQILSVTFTPNDTVTYETVTETVPITVNPAALTITADNKSKIYGAALPNLTASYEGFVNGETAADLDSPVSFLTEASAASDVGSYSITVSGAVDPNYAIRFEAGALTVNPAPLTITAEDKTIRQGQALPVLTAVYSGFVNSDTPANLDLSPALTTTATASSPPGAYPIIVAGASDGNYTITHVNGTLTVTAKLQPVISWAAPEAIVYGTALGPAQLNASADVPGTFAYEPAGGRILSAGRGQILSVTFTPDDSVTYETVTETVAITVHPAPLTITADNKSKTYGAALPNLTAGYDGFVNGETAADLDSPVNLSTEASATSDVGSYSITVSGAVDSNYDIRFEAGALTINPAPLTITAEDKAIRQGQALPVLTAAYSGFVNSDTPGNLDRSPALTTTATASSPPGAYPIIVAGASDGNYTITHVNGTLTVTAKLQPVISWAVPDGIVYGTALGPAQLNASADVPGTFAYEPAGGTILSAGQGQILSVTFTPNDSVTYETVTETVAITVDQAVLTVSGMTAADKVYESTVSAKLDLSHVELIGGIPGDDISLRTENVFGVFGDKEIGTGKRVIVSGLELSGTDARNYSLLPPSVTGSILAPPSGHLVAWGANQHGQATVDPALGQVVALAGGEFHSLALKQDGSVFAWGSNAFGQANVPDELTNVLAIAAGANHNLVLTADGGITGWGRDHAGQGQPPSDLTSAVSLAAGGDHSMALREDGTIVVWGSNSFGQANIPPGLSQIVAVAAGRAHNLALEHTGTVLAWGNNASGQTDVPLGLSKVVAIAAGGDHSVALKEDGTVVAWGSNESGQTNVSNGSSKAVSISAGENYTLVLMSDGTVASFGGSPVLSEVAARSRGALAIAAGWNHNLAILTDSNTVPVPRNLFFERSPGAGIRMAVSKLVQAAYDPDGDVLELAGFDAVTETGASVQENSGWLIYQPADGNNDPDSFSFTIADGRGAMAAGTLFISVQEDNQSPTQNITKVVIEEEAVIVQFVGIPEVKYQIESTASLTKPEWQSLGSVIAGSNGRFELRDVRGPDPTRFYRAVFVRSEGGGE